MQRLKFIFGVLVALGTLAFLVLEQLSGASFDAKINANVSVVRSPISGFLDLSAKTIGETLYSEETVGLVQNPYVDEARLSDLEHTVVRLHSDISTSEAESKTLQNSIERIENEIAIFTDLRKKQLEGMRSATKFDLTKANIDVDYRLKQLNRSAELAKKGVERASDFDLINAEHDRAEAEVARLESVLSSLEVRIEGANSGLFLGADAESGGYQNVVQRLNDLKLQLAGRADQLAALTRLLHDAEAQLHEARLQYNLKRRSTLTSPVTGIVWRLAAADKEFVNAGAPVMEVVDCSNLFVTLTVTSSTYNALNRGDPVRFVLNEDDTVYDGKIIRLAGSGAKSVYTGLAVGTGEEQLKRFDVAIEVPALLTDKVGDCRIGTTGRVYFTSLAQRWIPQIFR